MGDKPGDLVARLRAAVPEGRTELNEEETALLRVVSKELLAARPDARLEYERFEAIRERGFDLPADELAAWIGGSTIVVTGGTGCIGSALLAQLSRFGPARVVSLTRGATTPWARMPDVEYMSIDIRDRCRLGEMIGAIRPDTVFHLAAQRQPARAEVEVHRTVTTNVFGTRNVIEVCEERDVPLLVAASTGKALRPYSPDVYAASKRAGEWLLARAAGSGRTRIAATRFTHVVDNSIILDRLQAWCKEGVIRLHGTGIGFYAQSALESAQLLLCAGLGAVPGALRVHALRDLGWPVTLLDLALGVIDDSQSESPIYVSGYERGYEETPFPGLYDPRTAGDVSPLINAFEALGTAPTACADVDAFSAAASDAPEIEDRLTGLERTCAEAGDPASIRPCLDSLSWALLDSTLRALPPAVVARAARIAGQHEGAMSEEHRRILTALNRWSG